jgi:WD40-like Beta Propeller Repeat
MDKKSVICSIAVVATLPMALATGIAHAQQYSAWGLAASVVEVNSPVADGCPIESPDGLSLYIASMRVGGFGGNDIYVADRTSKDEAFGTPQNLGAPVNTAANDFCPTPLHGNYLMFVSERPGAATCNSDVGRGDIYRIRQSPAHGWGEPQHLGCLESGTGPNTAGAEFSPSLVETDAGTFLYFSSTVSGNHDIYVSQQAADGSFGPPTAVTELNTEFDDRMPNVSKDGREIVFSSNRTVDAYGNVAFGSFDVYVSSRSSSNGTWSSPRNLGANVNTAGSETRSTMSWDRTRLYFGRDGEIFSASRVTGGN